MLEFWDVCSSNSVPQAFSDKPIPTKHGKGTYPIGCMYGKYANIWGFC